MSHTEIESADVIKVMLQFCKENNLMQSFQAIQAECQVSLNTVDSLEQFVSDITAGRWDVVLPQVATLKLPRAKLEDLYEQVVLELIELREGDTARAMLRQTQVFHLMRRDEPERYLRLDKMCAMMSVEARDLYLGQSREKRRAAVAQSLSQEVAVVPPSRLLTLIDQALRWQKHQGLLPPGAPFDLFRGAARAMRDEVERPATDLDRHIKFAGKKSHPECARFSPDGQMIATGSLDGFIEIWDSLTGRLKKDLQYQADDQFLMHDAAVLSLAFSGDSEGLASGSQDGVIKVWKVRTGQCARKFKEAHTGGVTSVCFSKDGSQILSASFDGTIRAHGLKSGKLLKEFRGHTSYVNSAIYSPDGGQVITASSDATVRLWDAKTCECSATIRPPQASGGRDAAVNDVHWVPGSADQLVVCNRSPTVYIMNLQGLVVKSFQSGKREGGDFLGSWVSPRGEFIYCLGEDSQVYIFSTASGKLESLVKAFDAGAIGLCHHPHRNSIAVWAEEGALRTYIAAQQA